MINETEDRLFKEWKGLHPDVTFARDGVFGPDRWDVNGRQKVVFILKEPNNHERASHDWDMRPWNMENNSQSTWCNIARWGYALRRGEYGLPWDEVRSKGTPASNRYRYTRGLAILNLNKGGGGANCNEDNLITRFERDFKSLVAEQLKLYSDARFVVCCGQLITDVVRACNLFGDEAQWREYKVMRGGLCVRKVPYCLVPDGPVVIGFVHPNIRQDIIKGSRDRNRDAYEILMELAEHLNS